MNLGYWELDKFIYIKCTISPNLIYMVTEMQKAKIRKYYSVGNKKIEDKWKEVSVQIEEAEDKVSSFMKPGELQEPFNDMGLNRKRQLIENKKENWDKVKTIMEETINSKDADGDNILKQMSNLLKELKQELSQI